MVVNREPGDVCNSCGETKPGEIHHCRKPVSGWGKWCTACIVEKNAKVPSNDELKKYFDEQEAKAAALARRPGVKVERNAAQKALNFMAPPTTPPPGQPGLKPKATQQGPPQGFKTP